MFYSSSVSSRNLEWTPSPNARLQWVLLSFACITPSNRVSYHIYMGSTVTTCVSQMRKLRIEGQSSAPSPAAAIQADLRPESSDSTAEPKAQEWSAWEEKRPPGRENMELDAGMMIFCKWEVYQLSTGMSLRPHSRPEDQERGVGRGRWEWTVAFQESLGRVRFTRQPALRSNNSETQKVGQKISPLWQETQLQELCGALHCKSIYSAPTLCQHWAFSEDQSQCLNKGTFP